MDYTITFGFAYGSLMFTLGLIVTFGLLKWRHNFPIKERRFVPLLVAIMFTSPSFVISTVFKIEHVDCVTFLTMISMLQSGVLDTYFVRFFSLWYSHKLQHEQLLYAHYHQGDSEWSSTEESVPNEREMRSRTAPTPSIFIKYQWVNKNPSLNAILCVLIVLRIVMGYVVGADTMEECPRNTSAGLAVYAWSLIYVVSCTYWAFSLRKIKDNMKIRSEMYMFSVWLLSLTVVVVGGGQALGAQVMTVIRFIMITPILFISGVFPLCHVWKHMENVKNFDPDRCQSLSQQLSSPEGFDAFLIFLQKEFSIENLLFYDAVEKFRQHFVSRSRTVNTKSALKMYAYFLSSKSPLQVNVGARERQKVMEKLGIPPERHAYGIPTIVSVKSIIDTANAESAEVEIGIFDNLQTLVLNLMDEDSYCRYVMQQELRRKTEEIVGGNCTSV